MVMQYDDDDRPAKDWILRTDYGLDGDSLSYEDRLGYDDQIFLGSKFILTSGWRGKGLRKIEEPRRDN